MLKGSRKGTSSVKDRCDVKVWSGACEHGSKSDSSEKYLCSLCETVPDLDHEVRHEVYPHVSGDYDRMM